MKNFEYKSRFNTIANLRKHDFAKGSFVSKASMELEGLKSLMPSQQEINENPDLLYTCFNAAVANLVNGNDDAIQTDTALMIASKFPKRPMNVEHERNMVIGYMTNSGFSTFGDNQIVSAESLTGTSDPFNISLAAIVWKIVDDWMSYYIAESSDPDSWCYKNISTSWELGFNDYQVIIGSKKLADAEIITDKKQIKELTAYLRQAGGTGFMKDGTPVYRLIVGDVMPLGCAFTTNPAAAVSGVMCAECTEEGEEEEDEMESEDKKKCKASQDDTTISYTLIPEVEELQEKFKQVEEKLNVFENKISQISKSSVTLIKSMKFNSIDEICDKLAEASADVTPGAVRSFLQDAIKAADEKYTALKSEKDEQETKLSEAAALAESTKAELDQVKETLKALEDQLAAQAKQEAFNTRMAQVSEKYDLNDKAKKIVAKTISNFSDEQFTEWFNDEAEVILASFIKSTEPGDNTDHSDALKKAQASVSFVPNAGSGEPNSGENEKAAKLKDSFTLGKGIEINKK